MIEPTEHEALPAAQAAASQLSPVLTQALTRPARVAIGWMADDMALGFLNGRRADLSPAPEQVARVTAARQAVAARVAGPPAGNPLSAIPQDLEGYASQLRAAGAVPSGWTVGVVD